MSLRPLQRASSPGIHPVALPIEPNVYLQADPLLLRRTPRTTRSGLPRLFQNVAGGEALPVKRWTQLAATQSVWGEKSTDLLVIDKLHLGSEGLIRTASYQKCSQKLSDVGWKTNGVDVLEDQSHATSFKKWSCGWRNIKNTRFPCFQRRLSNSVIPKYWR
jgi:hypothetical protein